MRTIKFRAWDTKRNVMIFFEQLSEADHESEGATGLFLRTTGSITTWESDFKNLIWLQWTGLLDKNGKEIYEGDIVTKDGKVNAKVVYEAPRFFVVLRIPVQKNSLAGYGFADDGIELIDYEGHLNNDCEIIGNIYENPGLLK